MRVGVDLDGVLYSFTEDSRDVCADWLNVHRDELQRAEVWDFPEVWGIPMDTFWKIWFEDVARGRAWRVRPPEPGSVEGLMKLQEMGHTIHIITSRKGGEAATVGWLQEFKIPYDTIHIGRMKTIVDYDILFDDWERNYIEAREIGKRCVVWDQPWNRHLVDAERVTSWDEAAELIGPA